MPRPLSLIKVTISSFHRLQKILLPGIQCLGGIQPLVINDPVNVEDMIDFVYTETSSLRPTEFTPQQWGSLPALM